jgi:transposase
MEIDILGIDLAKEVFQLHGADRRGQAVHRAKVSRGSLAECVRTLKPRLVVMEACSTAHHWARRFQSMGTEVRLISPQYVTPFVKTNKNDRNDAEAIVEAASRPTMRFVPVKSVEQQDIQAAHRMRAHPAAPPYRADQPDARPSWRTRSCDLAVTGSIQACGPGTAA